jgi:hypothetical protein
MRPKKNLAAIEERIVSLESAYASLRAQVVADSPGQKQKWQEAVDSILGELDELKPLKLSMGSLSAQQQNNPHGHGNKIQQLLDIIEAAEKVVFKAFVLAATCVGAVTLLSHEIQALEHPAVIEERAPKNQDITGPPKYVYPSVDGGPEPIPEPLKNQKDKLGRDFVSFSLPATGGTATFDEASNTLYYVALPLLYKVDEVKPPILQDWIRVISTPDSVHSSARHIQTRINKPQDVPTQISIIRSEMKES